MSKTIQTTRGRVATAAFRILKKLGGSASPLQVSKAFYRDYPELRNGQAKFTWQYDLRWGINLLRQQGSVIRNGKGTGRNWTLAT